MTSARETVAALVRRATDAQRAREEDALAMRELAVERVRTLLPDDAGAWLIGSLAWGGFGEHSDVDVVTRGLDERQASALERALLRELRREVDVLRYETLSATFRARVQQDGLAIR